MCFSSFFFFPPTFPSTVFVGPAGQWQHQRARQPPSHAPRPSGSTSWGVDLLGGFGSVHRVSVLMAPAPAHLREVTSEASQPASLPRPLLSLRCILPDAGLPG